MADLATPYVYTTGAGTITFNNGNLGDGTDKFWLQAIMGLDGPNVRAPVDNVPMGDGSLIHEFWLAGITPVLEGVLLVESVPREGSACQAALNVMEAALRAAVMNNVTATATLAWTPTGQAAQSLSVFHNGQPRLDITPTENFHLRQFVFGLISDSGSLA